MVWVCPPHTSMNLKWSPPVPARCSMATSSLRAAAGSRNSSTNFITRFPSNYGRRVEGFHLGGVGVTEFLDGGQGEQRLRLVDLGHREPDMDQYPFVRLGHVVLQQAHTDRALHAADVDLRQIVGRIGDFYEPTWNPKTHLRL